MLPKAIIFDVDGTLIDSNDLHALAWQRAFEALGEHVAYDPVRAHMGMGGDKVVPALLGQATEDRIGEELRAEQDRQLQLLLDEPSVPKRAFPEVLELIDAVKRRGIRTAIATSSERQKLERLERAFAIELAARVDEVVTSSNVEESKPAPDLVCATLEKLGLDPAEATMIGDTPYDANACRSAGVDCVGVRSGGWSDTLLRAAGARVTFEDTAELHAALDRALQRGQ